MKTLPTSYKPSSLVPSKDKKRKKVMYAIGYHQGKSSYGMAYGPTDQLKEMLEIVPDEKDPAFIFRFNADGTDEHLYKWNKKREAWVRRGKQNENIFGQR